MKNNKLFAVLSVALILLVSGCGDSPSGDIDIGEITITNIPARIFVWDPATNSATEASNPTFKVYLNASDSMEPTDPPAAKGLVRVSPQMLQSDGTYTVTIQLQNPNPAFGEPGYSANPNMNTGSWSGTARYFSIMISPQNTVPHGVNAIWAKGVNNLDRGKRTISWDDRTFVNFRISNMPAMKDREASLYNDIVRFDPDITTR